MDKQKLLVIADTPTVSTGFGVVSKNILFNLPQEEWDIHILGINYLGDPHEYQRHWSIYPTGDTYGAGRIGYLLETIKPDCVFIINDPWVVYKYIQIIKQHNTTVPIVVYVPVDAPGIKPEYVLPLNAATHVVAYTHWAQQELIKSGLTVASSVISHGVDHRLFYPIDKQEARKALFSGVKELTDTNPFVVTYVARNQPRKRVDLFIYTMLKWIKTYNRNDVYFHYHGAPKGDKGNDIEHVTDYFTTELQVPYEKRLILTSHNLTARKTLPEDRLKYIYNGADVYFHACAVEGFGLPIAEAMACGVATLVPKYSALQDWPNGAVEYINVDETPYANPNDIDTIHKFISVNHAVERLERLYQDTAYRNGLATKAYEHMQQPRFHWSFIGSQFNARFKAATDRKEVQEWTIKTLV
jgi:glycosyltransferase involved in cell wall biosynthesis